AGCGQRIPDAVSDAAIHADISGRVFQPYQSLVLAEGLGRVRRLRRLLEGLHASGVAMEWVGSLQWADSRQSVDRSDLTVGFKSGIDPPWSRQSKPSGGRTMAG